MGLWVAEPDLGVGMCISMNGGRRRRVIQGEETKPVENRIGKQLA